MPTIDKTFNGGGTFSELGNSANIVFDPNGSAYIFTSSTSDMSNEGEFGLQSSGETWETWGVPAGATVTGVELVTYDRAITNTGGRVTDSLVEVDILNSAGSASVLSGVLLSNTNRTTGSTAGATGAGSRSVSGGSQASNTVVRLQFFNQLSSNSSSVTWSYSLDNLLLRITYTPAEALLSGTVSSDVSLTGSLTVEVNLAGTSSSGVSGSGALSVEINLSGTVSSALALSGELTVITDTLISGESTGGLALTGALSVEVNLAGTIGSGIALSGLLSGAYTWMGGSIDGSVSLSGSLTVIKNLSGTSSGSVSLSGTLSVVDATVYLSGTIVSSLSLSGDIVGGAINVDINREIYGRRYLSPSTKKSIRNI
jgi:hypothetical protein